MKMLDRLIEHMNKYGSITSWEAIQKYGCTRLSQYIHLMRKEGMDIETKTIEVTNRYGEKSFPVKYTLKGANNDEQRNKND